MMIKLLFSLFILLSTLFAASPLEMVKANPALLDTPQAKIELQKRGISKDSVLKKIASSDKAEESRTQETKNDITTQEESSDDTLENSPAQKANTLQHNPLLYKPNERRIAQIRKNQNHLVTQNLSRFSSRFFNNKNKIDQSSLPVPGYYVITPHDVISIWIYGAKEHNFNLRVDNNGNINLPTLGPIKVAGLSFDKIKSLLVAKLSKSYMHSAVAINISQYSTIQVTLVGDVTNAGIYNVSSLSSVKDLLIVAGGVNENGSVRSIKIKRNKRIVQTIDFYDMLLGLQNKANLLLRNGDVIVIPKAKKLIKLSGAVNKAAIYELKKGEKLDKLFYFAGGMKASASQYGIKMHRYIENKNALTLNIDLTDIKKTELFDLDAISVYAIDSSLNNYFSIYGNVVRPGKRDVTNSSLSQILNHEITNLGLSGLFLDETLFHYALLKRKNSDLTTKIFHLNLQNIINQQEDFTIQAQDELFIFNTLDTQLNPYVSIAGSVVKNAQKYQYHQGLTVYDLIQVAGTTGPYDKNSIKVVTYDIKTFMPIVKLITIEEAMEYEISPFDEVVLYDYYYLHTINQAVISGEVNLPNVYTINEGMTLDELITIAGGFKQEAYLHECEIIRYSVVNFEREKEIITLNLRDSKEFIIKAFDEITIRKIPKWSEKKHIRLTGEVKFPGSYTIEEGDRLVDVIKRAGGYTKQAFLKGAVFTRESIRTLQQNKLNESLLKLKKRALATGSSNFGQESGMDPLKVAELVDSLARQAESLKPIGRISITLMNDLDSFQNSRSNLTLKESDTLHIPSFNDTILVIGEVMSPSSLIFDSSNTEEYLKRVGGLTEMADDDYIYIVHANGEAERYKSGWFTSNIDIKQGDAIIVPQEIITFTGMQIAKDVSMILYQFAITMASLSTIGVL